MANPPKETPKPAETQLLIGGIGGRGAHTEKSEGNKGRGEEISENSDQTGKVLIL